MPYPSPFPEPPHLQGVPTFLRKSYHTDDIDVVPPQKNTKQKNYSKVHNIMHVFNPLVTPLKVQKQIPSSSPHRPPSGAMIIFDK